MDVDTAQRLLAALEGTADDVERYFRWALAHTGPEDHAEVQEHIAQLWVLWHRLQRTATVDAR